ncbi:MAG: hypothetical protein J3K34DRAFT_510286 [Monoraphidium minutum]|nr:MAG: hypothetical protein J3K34DRAFT_510286 [Monoraphidium minutum]
MGGGVFIPSADVLARYGRWRAPDPAKATAALRAEHAHHDFFDAWGARLTDLREFGTGHLLYFHFLQWMALLFSALFICVGVPQIVINTQGRYYAASDGGLKLTMLGNFGRVSLAHAHDGAAGVRVADALVQRERNTTLAFLSDGSATPALSPFNKRAAIVAMSILDAAGAGAFFLVTLALIVVSRRQCAQADSSTVTIHDYSIRVERLPGDAGADELAELFGQYGEVVHVEVVRAYGELLGLVLRRGRVLRALKRAVAHLQREAEAAPEVGASLEVAAAKVSGELYGVTRRILEEQAHAGARRAVAAFVTFREEAGKAACLRAQPRSRMRQWLALKPRHKLRGRYALSVSDAPEPSDVKYENIEHGTADRAARRLLTASLQYLSLAAGFALVSMASAMRFNQAGIAGDSSGMLALGDAARELMATCASTGYRPDGGGPCGAAEAACYKCYCYEALSAGMLNEAGYCMGQAWLLALQYGAQAVNVVGILAINMFLNSALSTIVANAHLPGLSKLVAGTRMQALFFQGIYTDLTPNWYKTVGMSVVTSQFVATAVRLANTAATWGLLRWRVRRRAACLTQARNSVFVSGSSAGVTPTAGIAKEEDLQEAMRGPSFDLDWRYGEHLNVIFVALLISGGVPVAYASAAVWFTAAYWSEKWELLRLSRRPVAYGGGLSEAVTATVPYAVVLHLVFALWAYSFFGTPTSRLLTPVFGRLMLGLTARLEPVWRDAIGLPSALAAHRLVAASGLHLLAMLVVVVGVLAIKLTLTAWAKGGRSLLSLAGVIADSDDQQITGAPEFAIALRTQLLVGGTTYAIQAQPEYEAAFGRPDAGDGGGGDGDGDAHVQVSSGSGARKGGAAAAAGGPRGSPRAPARRQSSGAERRGGGGGGGAAPRSEVQQWMDGEGPASPGGGGPPAQRPASTRRPESGPRRGGAAEPQPAESQQQPQAQQQEQRLPGPARYRRARENQVVPIADEFLPPRG